MHKPPGLLVHRTGLDAFETRFALQMLRGQLGRHVWPVHRLDKGTSGVLVFALSAQAARHLGQQFDDGAVQKTYHAMVRGWPPEAGAVDHPLRRVDDFGNLGPAQSAHTQYRRLARYALPLRDRAFPTTRCALVELQPSTGRQHQLRRHCKHIAHPIVGDATHGKGPLNRALAQLLGQQRLWLQAHTLCVEHPVTRATLALRALVEPDWDLWNSYIFNSV